MIFWPPAPSPLKKNPEDIGMHVEALKKCSDDYPRQFFFKPWPILMYNFKDPTIK